MMYNNTVMDCFFAPRHVGRIDESQSLCAHYHTHQKKPDMVLDLYLHCTESGTIDRMCFKASGNPYLIASLEWLCRQVEGHSIKQLPDIGYQTFIKQLAMPHKWYPIAILVDDAYKEAMKLIMNQFERHQ